MIQKVDFKYNSERFILNKQPLILHRPIKLVSWLVDNVRFLIKNKY